MLFVAFACLGASAETTVRVQLEPPVIPIYRTAIYSIVVDAPSGLTPQIPRIQGVVKDAEITALGLETIPTGEGRARYIERFRIDPEKAGELRFPGATIELGAGQRFNFPPITLHVREPSDAEVERLAQFVDIASPTAVVPAPQRGLWWISLGLLLLIVVGGLAYWYYLRTRPVDLGPPPLKPWQAAQKRLDELAARRLPNQGKIEPFYVDLSAILRYYIEDRFHLQAPERTTEEFLTEATGSGVLSGEQQEFLAQFLRLSDRVKFARFEPSFEEMEASFDAVRRFVIDTTPTSMELEVVGDAP